MTLYVDGCLGPIVTALNSIPGPWQFLTANLNPHTQSQTRLVFFTPNLYIGLIRIFAGKMHYYTSGNITTFLTAMLVLIANIYYRTQ